MLAHIGMAMPETGTLDFLMDSIPHAYGPDDCSEWKTVIDEARRRRVLKEGEDAKKNKKPVTNGSSANSNESNTHSNHQGAPASGYSYQAPYRGYRGGRSGYRGGNYNTNRGSYRGAPYHRHEGECEEYVDEAEAGSDDVINNNTVAITKEVTSLKDKSLLEETHPEVAKESAEDERGVVVATAEEEQSEEECEEVIAIEETHTEQGKTKVEASSEEIKMEQKPETATKKKKKRKARKRMPANGGVRVITREDIVKTMIAVLEERERRSASGDSEGSSKEAEEAEEAEVKFAAATMVEEIAADPDVEDAQATEHEGYTIEHDVVTSSNLLPFESPGCILHFNASKKAGEKDNRIFVPIIIRQERHYALIDTGATHSFISKTVVDQYRIPTSPQKGLIHLADRSTIPRYGFNLMGLPDPEMATEKETPPKEDDKPTLIPLQTPLVEETSEFIKEKQEFMRKIKDALKKNAQISPQSHCPIPEMKVFLAVPEGVELYRRPRVFAASQVPILDAAVEAWIKDDVIMLAPAGNRYNNTLTLAAKKDLEGNKTLYRVCLDPRPLNAYLPDDNFPVPLISDIMNFAGGNEVFTTIDLRQAYHRLPIHAADRNLTAFMHGGVQYMFKKAPFGLKPLSSLFQRGMSRILGDLKFVRNFIDDILIASKNKAEHAEHVRIVIERLTEANLIINGDKCRFYSTQVALLGFIIDVNGKRVDPNKLANIDEWKAPTTGKQVMSYMGTFNFFREFVPLINTVAAP
ncbi:hypothetical protein EMPS_06334 [Entomortierella parvispora]|uniref:Reverse transcriptase domain-containing protein n=1 Tax=Entomortierella parvispora TaxID=205924 RepID=A0A9P3LX50_9FUNG|nr:hypothetical protein EMPS_06334 [Entomortierella parvispora]